MMLAFGQQISGLETTAAGVYFRPIGRTDSRTFKEGITMRLSKALFVCVCLVGLTQLVWSQSNSFGASHGKGVPGYLDPRTGKFTTQVQNHGGDTGANPDAGTAVLFREQFNITITNYDQPTTNVLVVCSANISSYGDPNGYYYDDASIVATQSGKNYTCDVPILTSWTLQNPGSDTITAYVTVDFVQVFTLNGTSAIESIRRQEPPYMTLPVPQNGHTVITTLNLTM